MVLPDALHSIRSLLSTATNCTPHERLFNFQRKSTAGNSFPSWLAHPGPVYVKKHVRGSKYEPLVEEAELIEANPEYAFIRLKSGHETTVSLRDLAPCTTDSVVQKTNDKDITPSNPLSNIEFLDSPEIEENSTVTKESNNVRSTDNTSQEEISVRRTSRISKPPMRFADFKYSAATKSNNYSCILFSDCI